MSTFERVKRNILRDMELSKVHTAASWCNIFLKNCDRLTDIDEQKKFWNWFANPYDDENHPEVQCDIFTEHKPIEQVKHITVAKNSDDEKSEEIVLEQEYTRNGLAMLIKVKPVTS